MKTKFITVFLLFILIVSCKNLQEIANDDNNTNNNDNTPIPTKRFFKSDLKYIGAFKLPINGTDTVNSWQWGGFALTYYPDGDKQGENDGYPGSLFGAGHAWEYRISEISIPKPVNSQNKNLAELPRAKTIQNFQDILNISGYEIPRVGIEYLPNQGNQTSRKLYFCFGQHFQESGDSTHSWCDLNLSLPNKKGYWYLDVSHHEYNTNDYMFEIPSNWANKYIKGYKLATGRFRDGGWSGQGPSVFAIAPWLQGNPPADGTKLNHITLLKYTSTEDYNDTQHTMNDYHNSDEWGGAVWLTKGDRAAVIFVGTKGKGDCWYGNQNGPCMECDDRGWWSSAFDGVILFYDTSDFAKVAKGEMKPHEPQPYATLKIDKYLYHIHSTQQKHQLGAAAFDRKRGCLYIVEPNVDDDRPIIHVWKIE